MPPLSGDLAQGPQRAQAMTAEGAASGGLRATLGDARGPEGWRVARAHGTVPVRMVGRERTALDLAPRPAGQARFQSTTRPGEGPMQDAPALPTRASRKTMTAAIPRLSLDGRVEAGCMAKGPVERQRRGDRRGMFEDPFGFFRRVDRDAASAPASEPARRPARPKADLPDRGRAPPARAAAAAAPSPWRLPR